MKKLLLISGLLVSGFSFAADWVLVTQSNNSDTNHFIDRDYYKYNLKTRNVEVWELTKNYIGSGMEQYTSSKTLTLYDCVGKRQKTLGSVEYNSSGYALRSSSQPAKSFNIIFPDTVGESYWEAACKTKGKGLYLPLQRGFINLKRLEDNNIFQKNESEERQIN